MSLCSGYTFHNERIVPRQTAVELEGFHSIEATNFLSHTADAESLVTSTVHAPTSSVKNPFSGFSIENENEEPSIGKAFSSNKYYLQRLIVRVRHTELIFPFHYFW